MRGDFRKRAAAHVKEHGSFDIAVVAASVNIVDVIGKFVPLKTQGHEHIGLCPFHADRTPSFRVVPKLGKSGRFICFSCKANGDDGGDVVDFIRRIKGVDYREACRYLAGDAPLEFMEADRERLKKEAAAARQRQAEDAEKKRKRAYAWWKEGRAIAGTPVENYLRNARGIQGALPDCLRFVEGLWCDEVRSEKPCMIGAMVDANGSFAALHRTWVAQGTDRIWRKAKLETPKKIMAPFTGAALRLHSPEHARTLYVAEGIETALSVREGLARIPNLLPTVAVWAAGALFNVSRLHLPVVGEGKCPFETIVLCMDADMADMRQTDTEILNACINYEPRGSKVEVVFPPDGMDFNDQLMNRHAVGA